MILVISLALWLLFGLQIKFLMGLPGKFFYAWQLYLALVIIITIHLGKPLDNT
jgi:hypothetical protein